MLDEVRDDFAHDRQADQVIVVEKEIQLVLDFDQFVDERRDNRLRGHERSVGGEADRRCADAAARLPQRLREMVEEARGFVVVGIDGHPCDERAALAQPVEPRERERRLAEAGGRLDHHEPLVVGLRRQIDEPRPLDQTGRQTRRQELRGEKKSGPDWLDGVGHLRRR
ncbi:hypothetical protein [Caballeronia temeraria]|uniref:hypothetical protein n=1 Tax=Caballeronia temeraria TaxID=1777137 RepID=UPI001FC9895F|nr:hypothetical protein [Caballeronia temeraria]